MLYVLGKVLKLGIIVGIAMKLFGLIGGSDEIAAWRELYYGDPMERHEICPYCEADLSQQTGFDGESEYWTCADCGEDLEHPDLFDWDEMEMVACCPFCDSDLTEQEGFFDEVPYWICEGCGAELLSPESGFEYVWFCEDCDAFLNEQDGFKEDCKMWKCKECGCVNEIDIREVGSYGNTVCIN